MAARELVRRCVEVAAELQRAVRGEQLGAQDARERARRDGGAGLGGDRLGGGIRLLGREAALLDRLVRGIAGGEDVAGHARVGVDLEEAVLVVRQAADERAAEAGEGDHGVRGDQPAVAGDERAVDDPAGTVAPTKLPIRRSTASDATCPKTSSGRSSGVTMVRSG